MAVLTDPLGWFVLEVPEGWQFETEDGVTTLRNPSGASVAYVSGGRNVRGPTVGFGGAEFLARFLSSLGVTVPEEAIADAQGAGCRIFSYRRESQGVQWRYWSVTDDETALLISHACPLESLAREASAIDGMVQSVRLFHSVPQG